MIDWPGVAAVEKPYEPFVVLVMHAVVDVGMALDVVMHASVTGPPAASLTIPLKVIVGFGVGVTVRVGLNVGGMVRVAGGVVGAGS